MNSFSSNNRQYGALWPRRILLVLTACLCSAAALWLWLTAAATPAYADTLCVKPGGGNGCQSSINAALALAQENDTIRVAAGTYIENVIISDTVTLQGGWNQDLNVRNIEIYSSTIRPLDNSQSVVAIEGQFADPNAVRPTLDGFVISGGQAHLGSNHGGGLRIRDSNALVISNTIQDNSAFLLGGGVWVQRGAPVLQGNHILNNQTLGQGQDAHGGGVQLENTQAMLLDNLIVRNVISGTETYGGGLEISGSGMGQVTLMRNRIISNTASISPAVMGFGGGIAVYSGQVIMEDSNLISNTASRHGGGIYIRTGGMISITNSALIANLAVQDGGGVYNSGVISLSNSTISGNSASGMGGGLANFDLVNLMNSTVANNSSGSGAGMFNSNAINIKNSLIALNLGDNCQGAAVFSQGNNLEDGGTCALGQPTDLSNTPPSMAQLGENGGFTPTHALEADSPAIDAGDNTACPAIDQRGTQRPVDGDGDGQAVCDIGAFEFLHQSYLPLVIR